MINYYRDQKKSQSLLAYISERTRISEMREKVQKGYKQEATKNKDLTTLLDEDFLLTTANRVILKRKDKAIQSKIRSLLSNT